MLAREALLKELDKLEKTGTTWADIKRLLTQVDEEVAEQVVEEKMDEHIEQGVV